MTHSLPIVTRGLAETATAAWDLAPLVAARRSIVELTQDLAVGNEDAFREFHRCYFDRLFRLALVLTRGDHVAAGDVLQDTLCRVARYARRFDNEEVFWCWLAALARSAAGDAGRKRRRYLALLENYARRWLVSQPPPTAENEQRLDEWAAQCLKELDPADRTLIEDKYLAGQSVRELAQRAQLTEKAVESRLGRLRQQLRARLLDRMKEDGR